LKTKSGELEESPRALSLRVKQGKNKVKNRMVRLCSPQALLKTKLHRVRHPIEKPGQDGVFEG
jgi:hypothetical protein